MLNIKFTEREKEILRLLTEDASLSVARLSEHLQVSTVTIRSDLAGLEKKGVILRSHGGAVPAFHPQILLRQNQREAEKNRIAQAAADLIADGDTVMIEAGTTTALVAKYLLGKRDVRIVTNSTLLIPFARTNPGLHLTVVGGEFRPATESLVGPRALEELERFHVRLAIVGTDGFSLQGGLTTHLVEGAEIVRKMALQAQATVLTADSSKHGQRGFVAVLPLTAVSRLITDAGLPAQVCRDLESAGLEVLRV
jgi:DeoR/GlpR family transcriptional regulator of sugar metabolism